MENRADSPDLIPTDDAGAETGRRYRYQWSYAAIMCCALLDGTQDVSEVFCEQHEDILLKHADETFTGIQVKTRASDQGLWKASDMAVQSAFARFASLEAQFPGKFRSFCFLANHPLYSAGNGQDIRYILQNIKESTQLSNVIGRARTFLQRISREANCSEVTAFSALKKSSANDDLPKFPDIDSRVVHTLAKVLPRDAHVSYGCVNRAAWALIEECARASSLAHKDLAPAYISAIGNSKDVELATCLVGKKIDKKRILNVLKQCLDVEESWWNLGFTAEKISKVPIGQPHAPIQYAASGKRSSFGPYQSNIVCSPDIFGVFSGCEGMPSEMDQQLHSLNRLLEEHKWRDASLVVRGLRRHAYAYSGDSQHHLWAAVELAEGRIHLLRGDLPHAEEYFRAAYELDSENSLVFVWYQHVRLLRGEPAESLRPEAMNRRQQAAECRSLRNHLALLHLLTGHSPEARILLGDETDSKTDPWALKVWVALHRKEGKSEAALAAARRCLHLIPRDPEAWFNYAVALRATVGGSGVSLHKVRQRPTGLRCAERCFGRAATLCLSPFDRSLRVLARAEQTLCRFDLGMGSECIDPAESVVADAATTSYPARKRWHAAMAEGLRAAKRWPEAAEHWGALIELCRDKAEEVPPNFLLGYSFALWRAGKDPTLTLAQVQDEGLTSDQQFIRAQLEIVLRSKDSACTDEELDRLLHGLRDRFSTHSDVEAFCGSVWAARQRWASAIPALARHVHLQPNDASSWVKLAHLRALAEDFRQAYIDIREGLRLQRYSVSDNWLELAISIAQRVHEHDQIITWCDEALQHPNASPSFLWARGLAHYEKRDYDLTTVDFRAYFSQTGDTAILAIFADSLSRIGGYNEACAAWRRLESLYSDDPKYSIKVVNTLVLAGDRSAAWSEMAGVMHRFPQDVDVLSYACQFAWADRRDEAYLLRILPGSHLRPTRPPLSQATDLIVARSMPDRSDTPLFERALADNVPFLIYVRQQLGEENWAPGQASFHLASSAQSTASEGAKFVVVTPVALMLIHDLQLDYLCRQTFGSVFYPREWVDGLQNTMFEPERADVGTLLRWTFAATGALLTCEGTTKFGQSWCAEPITQRAGDVALSKRVPLLVAEKTIAARAMEAGIPVLTLSSWLDNCKVQGVIAEAEFNRLYLQLFVMGATSLCLNSDMLVAALQKSSWKINSVVHRIFHVMTDQTVPFDGTVFANWLCDVWSAVPQLDDAVIFCREMLIRLSERILTPQDVRPFYGRLAVRLLSGLPNLDRFYQSFGEITSVLQWPAKLRPSTVLEEALVKGAVWMVTHTTDRDTVLKNSGALPPYIQASIRAALDKV